MLGIKLIVDGQTINIALHELVKIAHDYMHAEPGKAIDQTEPELIDKVIAQIAATGSESDHNDEPIDYDKFMSFPAQVKKVTGGQSEDIILNLLVQETLENRSIDTFLSQPHQDPKPG